MKITHSAYGTVLHFETLLDLENIIADLQELYEKKIQEIQAQGDDKRAMDEVKKDLVYSTIYTMMPMPLYKNASKI